MKRIKLILAVIAIVALAGSLVLACNSDSGSSGPGGDGDSPVNGWNGGKKVGGGGGGGGGHYNPINPSVPPPPPPPPGAQATLKIDNVTSFTTILVPDYFVTNSWNYVGVGLKAAPTVTIKAEDDSTPASTVIDATVTGTATAGSLTITIGAGASDTDVYFVTLQGVKDDDKEGDPKVVIRVEVWDLTDKAYLDIDIQDIEDLYPIYDSDDDVSTKALLAAVPVTVLDPGNPGFPAAGVPITIGSCAIFETSKDGGYFYGLTPGSWDHANGGELLIMFYDRDPLNAGTDPGPTTIDNADHAGDNDFAPNGVTIPVDIEEDEALVVVLGTLDVYQGVTSLTSTINTYLAAHKDAFGWIVLWLNPRVGSREELTSAWLDAWDADNTDSLGAPIDANVAAIIAGLRLLQDTGVGILWDSANEELLPAATDMTITCAFDGGGAPAVSAAGGYEVTFAYTDVVGGGIDTFTFPTVTDSAGGEDYPVTIWKVAAIDAGTVDGNVKVQTGKGTAKQDPFSLSLTATGAIADADAFKALVVHSAPGAGSPGEFDTLKVEVLFKKAETVDATNVATATDWHDVTWDINFPTATTAVTYAVKLKADDDDTTWGPGLDNTEYVVGTIATFGSVALTADAPAVATFKTLIVD